MPLNLKAPLPPSNFDARSEFAGFNWFQKWEIFQGVFTPGTNDIARLFKELQVPADLSGKRVLDVGTWNGCIALECERRGATEVIALGPDDPDQTGFYKLKELSSSSRTKYRVGTVYSLDPKELGLFDIIFFCGVLVHLRYPLLGIDNLRRVSRGDVYINTVLQLPPKEDAAAKAQHPDKMSLYLETVPSWRFLRQSQLNGDFSNWFVPNRKAVTEAFESAGFEIAFLKKGKFRATARGGMPEFLQSPSCESKFYGELMLPLFHPLPAATEKWITRAVSLSEGIVPEKISRQFRKLHSRYRKLQGGKLKSDAFDRN